ncbi:MAG: 7TM-DISM domain-containing protein, partial [SAR324 cluster bacterium]|nr:7TM-DISM domain-containing protein [SAR324 cluster bacterium]
MLLKNLRRTAKLASLFLKSAQSQSLAVTKVVLLLLVASLISPLTLVAGGAVSLQSEMNGLSLAPHFRYLVESNKALTASEAFDSDLAGEFIQNHQDYPNFGFSEKTFWVAFEVNNQMPMSGHWFIEFAYPLIDNLSLYQFSGKEVIQETHTGDSIPFTNRELKNRHFIFPVDLASGESQTLLLRIQSRDTLEIPLYLWSAGAFHASDHNTQTFIGMYFGIMAMMIVYNLLVYFLVRENVYLYYILATFSFSMVIMCLTGYAYEYLWPSFPVVAKNSRPFLIGTSIIFIGYFVKGLFLTPKALPKTDRYLNILMGVATVASLLA